MFLSIWEIVPIGINPSAVAGGNQTICSNGTAIVSGASATNGIIAWTENGAGSITSGANTLTPTYTAAAGDAGNTVTLTMTVTGAAPCATQVTATYTVYVTALPTATAGGNQTICSNGAATVSGATSANGTIAWTENGAGSITSGSNTLTPTYTAAAGDAGTTVTLTMTVTGCSSNAVATYSVYVPALPTANAGGTQTICSNGTATVSGATSSNGTILWTENGAGTITAGANTLTPTYTAAIGDARNTVTLTMTVTANTPCTSEATATYSVVVDGLPTATAGGLSNICNPNGGTATVSGATSSNGSIAWTENGAGSISSGANTLTPTYTADAADAGNTVTLTMTVTSNNSCGNTATSSATYDITVAMPLVATAGGNQTICSSETATVTGATATGGTIAWTENGAGSITSGANSLTPTYTAAAGDAGNTVTLTMTVTGCSNSTTATYSVFVNTSPTANVSGNQTICSNETATVSGATSSNGTILWTENGAGSITSGSNTLTPTYTAAAGDAGNTVILTMTVSNGSCTPATATYSIFVPATPTANANGSQTICTNGDATVSGASSSNGTISWTENGAGTITSGANTLTPTYTAAAGDAGNTVTLTMTVSNGTCIPAVATYSIIVPALPTANAGGSITINSTGTATVSGASSSNGTILWTENGAGTITSGETTLTPTYTAAAGDAGNTVTLTMTVTGVAPCTTQVTATYTINVSSTVSIDAFSATNLSVYPNPANSVLNIANMAVNSNVTMMNSLGQLVYSAVASDNLSINTQNLTDGVYFVRVNNQVVKVIISK
ncbi:MAG: T9SS type A sorting domain-containing protein [Bacteroidota bacterium]